MKAYVIVVIVPCNKPFPEIISYVSERIGMLRYLFVKNGYETILSSYFDWRKIYVWDDETFNVCWLDMLKDVKLYKSVMNLGIVINDNDK